MQVSNDIFFENLLEELLVSGYGLIYVKGYSMVPFLANEKDRVQLRRFDSSTEELKKEIQNYVKEHTAPYKYPRLVVFKDELPKTTSGKIIRSKL